MFANERNNSPSPSRKSLGDKLSSFGSKLSRTFSHDERDSDVVGELPSLASPKDRSQSRGREALQSTGRGGFGNIRQPSLSRDSGPGPDDFSQTRGREPVSNPTAIYSTGRGGAGNLRSPSRDANRALDAHEREVIENYVTTKEPIVSSGRGGLGNINRSRSRDPSTARDARVSTGRGGAGNIRIGDDGYEANAVDEAERKRHEVPTEGHHSTGRGGFANITEQDEPAIERPSLSLSGSTGRGGAGNIHNK